MPVDTKEVRESKRENKRIRRAVYRFLRDNRGDAFTKGEIGDAIGAETVDAPSPMFAPLVIERASVDGRRVYYARVNRLYWAVLVIGAIGLGATWVPEQYVRLYSFFAFGGVFAHWEMSVNGTTLREVVDDLKAAPGDLYLWLLRRGLVRKCLVAAWERKYGDKLVVVWPEETVDVEVLNGRAVEYHRVGCFQTGGVTDNYLEEEVTRLDAEREREVGACDDCFANPHRGEVLRPRL